MKKKRKYTRRKKISYTYYFKKLIIGICIIFLLHVLIVNIFIIFSDVKKSDILLISGDNHQNQNNLSNGLEKNLDTSIEIFQGGYAKKILIVGQKNTFDIDEVELMRSYIKKNDIWGGNIAYIYNNPESSYKNIKDYLQQNEWKSILRVIEFSQYQKLKNNFSYILGEENISLEPTNSGIIDSCLGIFTNYYYWWKK